MESRTLRVTLVDGSLLEATFLPAEGMTLSSFKRDQIEAIDPHSLKGFEDRHAGLGVLIGPHFHRRKQALVPALPDESLFPHIARCKAQGIHDPFSHGVARYAPWRATCTDNCIKAELSGKDLWQGVPLKVIEGQDFEMRMKAELLQTGLHLDLSVVSESDSLIGIHYYYALPQGQKKILSRIQPFCLDHGEQKPIDPSWLHSDNRIEVPLKGPIDLTFYPYPDPLSGEIELITDAYSLKTQYSSLSAENSWQLYHPEEASFVCIEPLSAKDPRHPNLTASSLTLNLMIHKK
jgi:hypothetical protein